MPERRNACEDCRGAECHARFFGGYVNETPNSFLRYFLLFGLVAALPICTLLYVANGDQNGYESPVRGDAMLVVTEERGYTPSTLLDLWLIAPTLLMVMYYIRECNKSLKSIESHLKAIATSQENQAEAITSLISRIRPKS